MPKRTVASSSTSATSTPTPSASRAKKPAASSRATSARPEAARKAASGRRGPGRTATRQDGEPFARIVVDVPEATHRSLKATAALEGKSIRDYILELLAENGIL